MATSILRAILIDQVNFLTAVSTLCSASKIYTTTGKSTRLQDLLQNFMKTKWNAPLITFLYMSLLSSISLDAVTYWGGSSPLVSSNNMSLQFIHGAVYFLVLCKWLEYSALWSTAVVISVLEEKRGFEAFSCAAKLIKGRRMVGFVLMLGYAVWRLSLGLPTFFEKWSFHRGVVYAVLNSSFLCVGQIMNWVVFVVYYHDCQDRHGEKIAMEDGGRYELIVEDGGGYEQVDTNVLP